MLHPEDDELFNRAAELGHRLADSIGQTCTIEPKRRPNGAEGLCYHLEKRISILVRYKKYAYNGGQWHKNPLPWKSISKTVAHEVAHLIHPNHSREFKDLEAELISRI